MSIHALGFESRIAAAAPAFPLRRATALITGNDHKAPSELRRLCAWFVAHLQRKENRGGARQVIKRDAATVLAYGDAAAFDTTERKEILVNLDKDDSYFMGSQNDATVFSGLADDDLAEDFITILDADVRSHLQATVLRALADGAPIERMSEKLREITLTDGRPLWIRERVAQVLIEKAVDRNSARQALLEDLGAMAPNRSQLAIRIRILAGMPADDMEPEELRQFLSEFDALPVRSRDEENMNDTGSLVPLSIALRRPPRADFFDETVRRSDNQRRRKPQVQSLLNQVLASAIDANPDISAERLRSWLNNVREHSWTMLDRTDVTEGLCPIVQTNT